MEIKQMKQEWTATPGKIAVVIMTFSGDAACLRQCLRGLEVQKKLGYDLDIHIIDDAANPINNSSDIKVDIESHQLICDDNAYNYRKSHFNRNFNLNGTECAMGMLMEMIRCSRESGAQYIMKVDCDMYIRHLDRFISPLKENPDSVVGFKLNEAMQGCAGVTYILPAKGLYAALKGFHQWWNESKDDPGFMEHCPEDWAITCCTSYANDFTLVQWDNYTDPSTWLLCPFNYADMTETGSVGALYYTKYNMYDFINFGNRFEMRELDKLTKLIQKHDPRKIAGIIMERFVDFDALNTYTSAPILEE